MAELEVHRLGARVICADGVGNGDDPGSQLMRDVGLAAARFERAMISTRTRAALSVKRSRGESTGTPPFGYRVGEDGKTLVADEHEQSVLAVVRGLRENGLSFRAVVDEATRLGLVGRNGRPFTLAATYAMTAEVPQRVPSATSRGAPCRLAGRARATRPMEDEPEGPCCNDRGRDWRFSVI